MGLLDALGKLVEWFVNFLPRPYIVRSTHGAVLYVRGKAKALQPGSFAIYWPFWTETERYPVTIQTARIESQSLLTDEGKPFAMKAVVRYSISDHLTALTTLQNIDEFIADKSLGVFKQLAYGRKESYLITSAEHIDDCAEDLLDGMLEPFGIKVEEAYLSDLTFPTIHKLMDSNFEIGHQQETLYEI